MGLALPHGGHLTHGWSVNFSAKYYKSIQYTVDYETERIDFENLRSLAKKYKPKLIWVGATAYPRVFEWEKFKSIADEVHAYLIADIAHIAGLIIAGVHPSPVGFVDVVVPGLYALGNKMFEARDLETNWHLYFLNSSAIKIVLTALIFYSFSGTVLSDQVYPKVSLTASDRIAMNWVAENIPQQSLFAVLTGETEAFADSVSEWFPVLSKSKSVATIQGYEWLPGMPFRQKLIQYYDLQACMNKTYKCVEQWEEKTNRQFDYIYISLDDLSNNKNALLTSLMETAKYQLVHQETDVYIFEYTP